MKRVKSKKRYKKGNVIYVELINGSFVDESKYGYTTEVPSTTEKELIKTGFKLIK